MAIVTPQSVRESHLPTIVVTAYDKVAVLNKESYLGTEAKPTTAEERAAYETAFQHFILQGIDDSP